MVNLGELEIMMKMAEIDILSNKGDSYHPNIEVKTERFDEKYMPGDTTRLPEIRKRQSFFYIIKKQLEPAKEVQYGRQ